VLGQHRSTQRRVGPDDEERLTADIVSGHSAMVPKRMMQSLANELLTAIVKI
jgi:hypothetical protein